MGRRKLNLTEAEIKERKERKKIYDTKYARERYNRDPVFRRKLLDKRIEYYHLHEKQNVIRLEDE